MICLFYMNLYFHNSISIIICQLCYTRVMLGFNHVLAGSIVAVIVPAPIVPIAAFVSHFVLDLAPHFGNSNRVYPYTRPFKIWLIVDAILCFACLAFAITLFPEKWVIVSIGAFFGTLPDFLWLLRHRWKAWFDRFLDWAEWIQWGERPYGWILDVFYGFLFAFTLAAIAGHV